MADEDLAALSASTGIDLEEEVKNVPSTEPPQAPEGGEQPLEGGEPPKAETPIKEAVPKEPPHMVPLDTMIAERREFQKQINELRARIDQRPETIAPKPVAELPDPFIDPKGFAEAIANARSQEAIKQAMESTVNPVQQQLRQAVDYLHRTAAEGKFGPEEITKADAEITRMQQTGELTQADAARIMATPQRPNVYENAVNFLRERALLAEVGGDFNAYKQRLLEEAMKDPEFLGRASEAARLYAAGQPAGQAPPQTLASRPQAKPLPSLNRAGSGAQAAPQRNVPTDEDFMFEALKGRR